MLIAHRLFLDTPYVFLYFGDHNAGFIITQRLSFKGGTVKRYIPGLALILAISLPARYIQSQITVNGKEILSAVAIAIVLGILIRNLIGIPDSCKAGTNFAVKRILRIGIALM